MSKLTKIELVAINATLAADNAALRLQLEHALLDLNIARADIVALADVASAMNTASGTAPAGFWNAKRAAKQAAANPTPTAEGEAVKASAGFWDHKKAQAESRGTTVAAPYQRKAFARTPAQEAARNAAMASGKTTAVAQ